MSYLAEVFGYEDFPGDGPTIVYEYEVDRPNRQAGTSTSLFVYKERGSYIALSINAFDIYQSIGLRFIKGPTRSQCTVVLDGVEDVSHFTDEVASTRAWQARIEQIRNRAMEALL